MEHTRLDSVAKLPFGSGDDRDDNRLVWWMMQIKSPHPVFPSLCPVCVSSGLVSLCLPLLCVVVLGPSVLLSLLCGRSRWSVDAACTANELVWCTTSQSYWRSSCDSYWRCDSVDLWLSGGLHWRWRWGGGGGRLEANGRHWGDREAAARDRGDTNGECAIHVV